MILVKKLEDSMIRPAVTNILAGGLHRPTEPARAFRPTVGRGTPWCSRGFSGPCGVASVNALNAILTERIAHTKHCLCRRRHSRDPSAEPLPG